jgi:hypothetical protein
VGAPGVRYKKRVEELLLDTMASPKNWSRLSVSGPKLAFSWENRLTRDRVNVTEKGYTSNGEYRVDYPTGESEFTRRKSDARKMAVDWMRNHPQDDVLNPEDEEVRVEFKENVEAAMDLETMEQVGPFEKGDIETISKDRALTLRNAGRVRILNKTEVQ